VKIKNIIFIALSIILYSCQTAWVEPHKDNDKSLIFYKKPPEFDKFLEVYRKPYIEHEYDCSNKSAEYATHLINKGIFSQILSIDHDGPNVTKLIYSERLGQYAIERHAIVRVYKDGKFIYADPANFKWSQDIKDFAPAGHLGVKGVINVNDTKGREFDF
jgi:hypothetical protein